MQAMVLEDGRLTAALRPVPSPGAGQVRLRVCACGVCRTDLHLLDGDLAVKGAIVPGHQIVGTIDALGEGVTRFAPGQRVGVTWLGWACGRCVYCQDGFENLCQAARFTGWTRDGGYAQMALAEAAFCLPIPDAFSDLEAAPLLCAGVIGFRAWRMAGQGRRVRRLGLYGFGAAAHLLAQLAIFEGQAVYAFTRPGDAAAQDLARSLGCVWAGSSLDAPDQPLDAAIIFAADGALAPAALRAVDKGRSVVCAGIHMSAIPTFDYADLWQERRLMSVANLTRADGADYLPRAAAAGVRPHLTAYPLRDAARALADLRAGAFAGAAVLDVAGAS
ncbi:zinc-binding alcohol dehydrogenase family protein [Caulobacter sp. 1776]|uniref:zinc-binding alcohol dehydrogenase family protein n=1 Tax=Caulobacter sp. 1776 TaxID=3156420 RepID=UPI003397F573